MRIIALSIVLLLATACSVQVNTTVKADSERVRLEGENVTIDESNVSGRVEALMAQMTIDEMIGQLNLLNPGGAVTGEVVNDNVGQKIRDGQLGGIFGIRGAERIRDIQKIAVEESRLGIPLIVGMDVIHGHQTVFPIPLAMSCSWDMDLIENMARISASEAAADGICWTFSPMVDIARDPRWGRIAEGAGEDPYLGSEVARAMVRGYQQDNLADPESIMACVKHFALYGGAEGGRDYATVDMSKLRMYNEYFPPYKAAIDEGCSTVMTSFNVVDYYPASGNDFLFTDVLRDEWGFSGMVVTDYTAINEMIPHGVGNIQEVSAATLSAGVDMDMVGEGMLNTLKKSLAEGKVTEKKIKTACRRILQAKEDLGLLDDPYLYIDVERAKKDILSESNRSTARTSAAETMVLLKNDNNTLPLASGAKVAVIGPLADSRRNMLGTWSVSGDHDKAVTMLEGMRENAPPGVEILYARGSNISDDPVFAKRVNAFGPEIVIDERSPDEMLKEAMDVAGKSDVIVAVVGEAADMTGEASSMAHIGLQPEQVKLLEALKTLGKPIVMVLYNGRPMTLPWEEENMDAILDVWFGGTEGGRAVADVLYGTVNPSAKLTTSFPVHVGQVPVYHSMLMTGRPDAGSAGKFRSNYLDVPNEPLFPFGYGLSYSTFTYSDLTLSATSMTASGSITASVTVTNTSDVAGQEIVQLYMRDVVGSISRPVSELKGFKKIMLEAGQAQKVDFVIDADLLKYYNADLSFVAEPGEFHAMIGPNSRDVQKLAFRLQ